MDGMATDLILKIVSNFGVPGIIFVVWYFSERGREKTMAAYREDTRLQLVEHSKALAEVRQMYAGNVHLVEFYQKLASEQKDVIIMSTQELAQLNQKIDTNQFCPQVRLRKQASGREMG